MKTLLAVIIALAFVVIARAQDFAGSLKFKNLPVSNVLDIYATLIDKKLVIEPGATNQTKTITLQTPSLPKKETAKLIESALREQAYVVITSLDEKSVSVRLGKK